LVVLAGVVVWWRLGFGIIVNPAGALTAAQARWDTAAVSRYALTVLVEQPFDENAVYELQVVNGVVTEAVRINPGAYRFSENPTRFEATPAEVAPYTIDGIFSITARVVDDMAAPTITTPGGTQVRYDPTYGYAQLMVENRCGLLFNSVEECLTRIEVLAFTPAP